MIQPVDEPLSHLTDANAMCAARMIGCLVNEPYKAQLGNTKQPPVLGAVKTIPFQSVQKNLAVNIIGKAMFKTGQILEAICAICAHNHILEDALTLSITTVIIASRPAIC